MIYIDAKKLKNEMTALLSEIRVNQDSAAIMVDSVIEASLKGIDTHGIALFPHYVEGFLKGRLNKNPNFRFLKDNGSSKVLDADCAIGHHAGIFAMDFCIDMASKYGTGIVAVKNSSHFGAANFFTEYAARHNMLAFAFTNTNSLVKAHNAVEPFFGTNPICFSAPVEGEEPFCLDMATSVISWNYVRNHKGSNTPLQEGVAYDENGEFTVDPFKAKCVRPIGDYKGFGLGMMIEILCSLLTDSEIGKDLPPMFGSDMSKPRGISHYFQAIDISKFTNPKKFLSRMKNLVERVRSLTPLLGKEVLVAGDPEKRTMQQRNVSGIPVSDNLWQEFLKISDKFAKTVKI
ncbi:MAG: Ldh family oxidoreductase [Bacteroidales bacterium]|nr:Ldh family oxidoreductase [Bacteroidales bacterium]